MFISRNIFILFALCYFVCPSINATKESNDATTLQNTNLLSRQMVTSPDNNFTAFLLANNIIAFFNNASNSISLRIDTPKPIPSIHFSQDSSEIIIMLSKENDYITIPMGEIFPD